jgi:hypothetical protein
VSELPLVARWRNAVRDSDLDPTAKLVAHTLATYMNSEGFCYPSKRLLARGCRKGEVTVDRAIKRLERAGFLFVVRSAGRTSNRYQATLPNPLMSEGVEAKVNPLPGVAQPPHQRPSTPSPVTVEREEKGREVVTTRAGARSGKKKGSRARAPDDPWKGIEDYDRG